jgi:hypothetical protein
MAANPSTNISSDTKKRGMEGKGKSWNVKPTMSGITYPVVFSNKAPKASFAFTSYSIRSVIVSVIIDVVREDPL